MISPIAAVILDFDGTVLDTEWTEYTTIRGEFERLGHPYPLEAFREGVGRGDNRHWTEHLIELTGPLPDLDHIRSRRRQRNDELNAASALRPGVLDLMERAQRRSLPLAIASSSPASWVEGHLDARHLLGRFDAVATGDRVERTKPWPDVFLEASRLLSVRPDRCLVVEDSHNGVAAAKAAGMICVAVPNPVTEGSDLSGADLVLESLADLPWGDFGLG